MFDIVTTGVPTNAQPAGSPQLALDKASGQIYISGAQAGWNPPLYSFVDALTALAGGGQPGATAITTQIARFTTVATGADSAVLPKALPGARAIVINAAAANAMAVFPATGEIINALSANASISVAANKTIMFVCAKAGQWNSILTA